MSHIRLLLRFSLFLGLFFTLAIAPAEDDFLSADQAFQLSSEIKDSQSVRLSWKIADGYHLYRERIRFSLLGSPDHKLELLSVDLPQGIELQEDSGTKEAYHHQLVIDVPFKRRSAEPLPVTLQVRYHGCADRGLCYPPITKTLNFLLPASASAAEPQQAADIIPPQQSEQDRIAGTFKSGSLSWVVLSFFGFGLLMTFTPCVFPMIPILSGIIVGHGATITTARALLISASYVTASALTYTVFGILAGFFGSNLQALFQSPAIIAAFSGVFVLLALSMFGFYELQIPSFIQTRLSALSGRQKGGTLINAAIMGALSALIVGPCMAAPLAGALIYIGQTGDALLGGLALFAMGLGMGAPLMLVGASAGSLLPRAGAWMTAIKSVFGLIMLGVAIWMLQRIIPASLELLLWGVLAIVTAVFTGALEELSTTGTSRQKLTKGIAVCLLIYGVALLTGAASGGDDALHPLKGLIFTKAGSQETPKTLFRKLNSPAALDAELEAAHQAGQPVILDFYADWCVSCGEMERDTFGNPRVQAALSHYRLLQADVTENGEGEKALLTRYGLVGPPATLFFDRNGVEFKEQRLVGYMGPEDFLVHLSKASLTR